MYRLGFKNIGSLVVAALIVGACSPLAPSVSKLSNAAAQKTSTTDGSSPASNLSTNNPLLSNKSNSQTDEGALPRTRVISQTSFQKKWTLIHDSKTSFQLPWTAYNDMAKKGTASFALDSEAITGQEVALLNKPGVRVFLVLSVSETTIASQHLNNAEANLQFNEESLHWELKLSGPALTGDPAQDADAERIQKTIREKLVSVAVAFDATDL